jgi:hypothetical protein
MTRFSEADWELVALDALGEHGWQTLTGAQIAPGAYDGRQSWDDIVLPDRMLAKMRDVNPHVPVEHLDQARAAIIQPQSQRSPKTTDCTRSSPMAIAASATSTPTASSKTPPSG